VVTRRRNDGGGHQLIGISSKTSLRMLERCCSVLREAKAFFLLSFYLNKQAPLSLLWRQEGLEGTGLLARACAATL